jgi:hypothetical protein
MYKLGRIKETVILGKTVNILTELRDIDTRKLNEAALLCEEMNQSGDKGVWFITLPEGPEAE